MEKTILKSTVAAAFAMILAETSQADIPMEKCKINGPDGKGLIKAGLADCASAAGNSCSGANQDGDPEAWIYVPQGVCEKIKGGCVVK
jgi:uncharacterized membrane protein